MSRLVFRISEHKSHLCLFCSEIRIFQLSMLLVYLSIVLIFSEYRTSESVFNLQGHETSIYGWVFSKNNQSTSSLKKMNLFLIIKNDRNHNEMYHFQEQIVQDSFPLSFNWTEIKQIQMTEKYLFTVLIFGYPHRLLWEGIVFRQNLIVNQTNRINFIVDDVCKKYFSYFCSIFVNSQFTEMFVSWISMFGIIAST